MIGRRAALVNVTGSGGVSDWFEPVDVAIGTIAVYVQSGAGVSAGAITVEEAAGSGQTAIAVGSAITVPAANAASVTRPAAVPTIYGALRLRVTTPIVGGNVSAWIVAG